MKFFLICFLAIVLSSCESKPVKSSSVSNPPKDETTATAPKETPVPQTPQEGRTADDPLKDETTATAPKETPVPQTPQEGKTADDPPKDETTATAPKETPAPQTTSQEGGTADDPPKDETTATAPKETPAPQTTSQEGGTADDPPKDQNALTNANIKSLNSLTLKDLEETTLLGKDGSNVYRLYMESLLLPAAVRLLNSETLPDHLVPLCTDKENCSKSLIDINKLNHSHIFYLLRQIGLNLEPLTIQIVDSQTFKIPPSLTFLQGSAPENSDDIESFIESMDQYDVRTIVINLSKFWSDPEVFFLLGEYIYKKQADLHIIGKCSVFCAQYLIPAAKTVIIEPYGYVSYRGSFSGFYNDFLEAVPRQEELISNLMNNPKKEAAQEAFLETFIQIKQFPLEQQPDIMESLLDRIQNWDKDSTKGGTKFVGALRQFAAKKGKIFVSHLSSAEAEEFFQGISPAMADNIKSFLIQADTYTKYGDQLISTHEKRAQKETDYYTKIDLASRLTSQSKKSYSYFDFVGLAARLVQHYGYRHVFSVPRAYYNVPEQDKPYFEIVPSGDLLRSLGLNIQGENHIDMFSIDENSKKFFLYLNNERIENCKFFKEGIFFTTDTLMECLGFLNF